jgi:hypothetical protein
LRLRCGVSTLPDHGDAPEEGPHKRWRPHALRKQLLERLLRPVGSLALAAIASGAVQRAPLAPGDAGRRRRITAEQFVELARFVDQVNPEVLQQILSVLT